MSGLIDIKQGPTRFYVTRTHDLSGYKYVIPKDELATCQDCAKIHTRACIIRVWGRNEGNEANMPFVRDVNPELDYCSRFEHKDET